MINNAENRRRMKIGKAISARMKPLKTLREVGNALGLTYQRVEQIEALALYKVASRLKELTNFEEAI